MNGQVGTRIRLTTPTMEKLYSNILENILFRLPIEPASQARRVCRTWRNLLANRGLLFAYRLANERIQLYYGEQHNRIHVDNMNYYYSHDKELIELKISIPGRDLYKGGTCNLIGSCNGLVCFKLRDQGHGVDDSFSVFNPLTGEVVFLPDNSLEVCAGFTLKAYGFGYCRATNKYKFVKMYYSGERVAHVQVCTIGGGWRNVASLPNIICGSTGIFVNEALHWSFYTDRSEDKTLTFDIEDEKFRLLPGPPPEACKFSNELRLLGGNLCFVQKNAVDCHLNIWAYKKNHNNSLGYDHKSDYYDKNSWNWIKQFRIKVDTDRWEPFVITRSNQVLLWRDRSILYCYDPTTSTLNELWDCDNCMGCSQAVAIPHTNSLISVKDLLENAAGDYKYYKTGEAVTLGR